MNGDDVKLPTPQPVKVNLSEPEAIEPASEVTVQQPQYAEIKKAIGIQAETKQLVIKSGNYRRDPEDEPYRQKVNYPA